jgi:hypothetical protein
MIAVETAQEKVLQLAPGPCQSNYGSAGDLGALPVLVISWPKPAACLGKNGDHLVGYRLPRKLCPYLGCLMLWCHLQTSKSSTHTSLTSLNDSLVLRQRINFDDSISEASRVEMITGNMVYNWSMGGVYHGGCLAKTSNRSHQAVQARRSPRKTPVA